MKATLLAPGDESLLRRAAAAFDDADVFIERATQLLCNPGFVMTAVTDETGEVMGRAYGYVLERFRTTDLLLYEIDVVTAHQNKGVGRALMEHLKSLCRERDYGEMWVLTEAENAPANALYAGAGGIVEAFLTRMYVFPTVPA